MKVHLKKRAIKISQIKKKIRKYTKSKNVNFLARYIWVMIPQTILCLSVNHNHDFCPSIAKAMISEMHSRPQRPHSFWSAPRIVTSGFTAVILVPRGRAPFGQHQESRPLAWSNDIPVLNGFVNTIDGDQNQSNLSDLTQSMRRVTGSP